LLPDRAFECGFSSLVAAHSDALSVFSYEAFAAPFLIILRHDPVEKNGLRIFSGNFYF
jgi:hypothetical protein